MKATLVGASLVLLAMTSVPAHAENDEAWGYIREMLFEEREILDGSKILSLDAPARAYDAAVVPIEVQSLIPQSENRWISKVTLIIDDNPAPVAGTFYIDQAVGNASLGMRVRINEYTNVRAVAETSDGKLYMTHAFVKAAGGCSAPATKDKDLALARIGKMKLKQMSPFAPGEINTAQILISHPNYTGLQIDQLTRNWIPPDYVTNIGIRFDDKELLRIEGDIALSEDPAITFNFIPEQAGELSVVVDDSEGRHFEQSWSIGPTS